MKLIVEDIDKLEGSMRSVFNKSHYRRTLATA